jgi:hypothetical protein
MIMAIADAAGFTFSAYIESASPHEVKLVEATIDSGFTRYHPDRGGTKSCPSAAGGQNREVLTI